MLSIQRTSIARQKAMEKDILHDLSSKIHSARQANNNCLPHKYIETILEETKVVSPSLTYNKIINYNRFKAVHQVVTNR